MVEQRLSKPARAEFKPYRNQEESGLNEVITLIISWCMLWFRQAV